MISNANLHNAKKAKNDEWYTRLTDIENECFNYKEQFKGKVIYCNCDDYRKSKFVKYFKEHYAELGITHLTATNHDNGEGAWRYEYDGKEERVTRLSGNGDFRSPECVEFLKQADIVVTNPPFSLFREYVKQLMEYGKKFVIVGNMNAITYKEIFPYIKNNEMWVGMKGMNCDMYFDLKDDFKKEVVETKKEGSAWVKIDGEVYGRLGNACWFTNLPHKKRNLPLDLYKKYNAEEFPKYDNYDAIEVSKVCDIPMDYDGVMGVPCTFLDKYCPEQFEIVSFRKGEDGKDLVFTESEKKKFNHTFVSLFDVDCGDAKKRGRENQWQAHIRENNHKTEDEPIDFFFPLSTNLKNGMINDQKINGKKGYCRILIRHKR